MLFCDIFNMHLFPGGKKSSQVETFFKASTWLSLANHLKRVGHCVMDVRFLP